MKAVARKITYRLHMDSLDDEGNIIAELATQDLTLYAHQFADLPTEVEAIVAQAEAQAAEGKTAS